jgi:hypothetical protein
MSARISDALAKLQEAEQALVAAKAAHEREFVERFIALCNEYELAIVAGGPEGSRLEVDSGMWHPIQAKDLDLE